MNVCGEFIWYEMRCSMLQTRQSKPEGVIINARLAKGHFIRTMTLRDLLTTRVDLTAPENLEKIDF